MNNIRTSETELKKLREDKKQRILLLHPGELKNIGTRIRELEDQVEDSKLARGALEKELSELKTKKEPEAANIRKRLAEELWPAALAEYEKLPKILAELHPILDKITGLNNEMTTLTRRHKDLVGESILTPQIPVPAELYSLVNVKLGLAPPKLDVRLATERERDHLKEQIEQQRPIVNKILERAGEKWPTCPECGDLMLAGKRGPDTPAYGLSEDGKRGFANFRCPKHSQWTRDIVFPAPPPPPGARYPIPTKDPAPLQSMFAVPPRNEGHGLADQPGLTDQHKGGEKTT